MSERRACDLAGISRTGFRYNPKPKDEKSLRDRLKPLACQHSRYSYLLLHSLLKQEGLVINKKRTYRLYTAGFLRYRCHQQCKTDPPLTI